MKCSSKLLFSQMQSLTLYWKAFPGFICSQMLHFSVKWSSDLTQWKKKKWKKRKRRLMSKNRRLCRGNSPHYRLNVLHFARPQREGGARAVIFGWMCFWRTWGVSLRRRDSPSSDGSRNHTSDAERRWKENPLRWSREAGGVSICPTESVCSPKCWRCSHCRAKSSHQIKEKLFLKQKMNSYFTALCRNRNSVFMPHNRE